MTTTWYAKAHDDDRVIASAQGYRACSDAAFAAMPWGGGPQGEAAPYYLTTIPPKVQS